MRTWPPFLVIGPRARPAGHDGHRQHVSPHAAASAMRKHSRPTWSVPRNVFPRRGLDARRGDGALAAVPPGATVALPRNIHRSVVAGLVLSGARPRFMQHDVLPNAGRSGVPIAELSKRRSTPTRSRRPCCLRGRATTAWRAI